MEKMHRKTAGQYTAFFRKFLAAMVLLSGPISQCSMK
jgi:hypothetical protein